MPSDIDYNDLELLTAIYSDKEQITSIANNSLRPPDYVERELKKRIRVLKITKKFGDNHLKILKLYDEMYQKHEDEMSKYCEDLEDKLCIKLMCSDLEDKLSRKLMCSEDSNLVDLCETLSSIHVEEVLEFHNGVYKMHK